MLKSEVEMVVPRSPRHVFAYLSDLGRHSEWARHKLRLRQTSSGSAGLGTMYDSVGVQLGLPLKDRVKVTEYVPDESFAYEAYGDLGDYVHYFRLRSEGEGTRIRYGVVFLGGPLYKQVGVYLLWPIVARLGLVRDLRRLKAQLEKLEAPS